MKNKKLSIRISDADLQTIHHKAEEANMTLTEYVTACCLGKEIVVVDGLDQVIRQQKGIGRNLNQLTTLANISAKDDAFSGQPGEGMSVGSEEPGETGWECEREIFASHLRTDHTHEETDQALLPDRHDPRSYTASLGTGAAYLAADL